MKITLENYNAKYIFEDNDNDHSASYIKDIFSRMLVVAGFSPSVIECIEGGSYEYVDADEIVIKKSLMEENKCQDQEQMG
jgi:hypothetical protein